MGAPTQRRRTSVLLFSCDNLYLTASGMFARDELTDEERNGALRIIAADCGL